jgi:hypothetical protein
MKRAMFFGLAFLSVAWSAATAQNRTAVSVPEYGINRFGGDYQPGFDILPLPPNSLGNTPYQTCQAACLKDSQCRSFTLVHAGIQGPNPKCWLKNSMPTPTLDPCCDSGVSGDTNVYINLYGNDIPPSPIPVEASTFSATCKQACINNSNCNAWTYVSPGIQAPLAQCWLKHIPVSPNPSTNTCCESGAVMNPPVVR